MPAEQERAIVRGIVRQGAQRGCEIGFPTANLAIAGLALPAGVYSGWLRRADGELHASAILLEERAAFLARRGLRFVKAHILDFDADIYGEVVTVALEERLREQRRFPLVDELVEQLKADIAATRLWWERTSTTLQLPMTSSH